MTRYAGAAMIPFLVLGVACSQAPGPSSADDAAGIDSLNARISQAYRSADPHTYAALYTDTAVFEWPQFNTVRGQAGLEAMARSNWNSLEDMDLKLTVSTRRIASGNATEFGSVRTILARPQGRAHDGVRPLRGISRAPARQHLEDRPLLRFRGLDPSTIDAPLSSLTVTRISGALD